MDELLNMPFDQLWSRTTRPSRRSIQGDTYAMPTPEIDYEALLALGRPQMVKNIMLIVDHFTCHSDQPTSEQTEYARMLLGL